MSAQHTSPQSSTALSGQTNLSPSKERMPIWVAAITLIGASLLMMGAVIAVANPAMLVSPQDSINGAVHIYAGYVASRDAALSIMLIVLLISGLRRALGNLMVVVALVQFLDVVADCFEMRWSVAVGVLVLGICYLAGAARLSRFPFWNRRAWQ